MCNGGCVCVCVCVMVGVVCIMCDVQADDDEEEASPATWSPIWSNTFPEAEVGDVLISVGILTSVKLLQSLCVIMASIRCAQSVQTICVSMALTYS